MDTCFLCVVPFERSVWICHSSRYSGSFASFLPPGARMVDPTLRVHLKQEQPPGVLQRFPCMFTFLHYLRGRNCTGSRTARAPLCANAKPIFHLINSGECALSHGPRTEPGCLSDTYGLFSNPPGVSGHDLTHSRCMKGFQHEPLMQTNANNGLNVRVN